MSSLPEAWRQRLEATAAVRRAQGRDRAVRPPEGLDFTSNDYLGLRRDPRLAEAAARAARDHGAGSGGARLLRGTTPLHEALEAELAAWKGQDACLLFNTGYQLNATVIPALASAGDAVFSDALNHASLVDGCRLAKAQGARVEVYAHGDLEGLDARLQAFRAQAPASALTLVATDAVFSMEGDAVDLPALVALCERHGALLLLDEAHASGLLGPTGAGLAEAAGLKGRIPLLMGTLGKALGSSGAFVACGSALRDHLVNHARGFIFSTSLPPAAVGASREALRVAQTEPWRRAQALAHAARLRAALGQPDQPSAIVPVMLGADTAATAAAEALQARGFDVRAVRPPTVPEGQARLRITTGAHRTEAEVAALAALLEERPWT